MGKLALLGGDPVINGTFAPYCSMGAAEGEAVAKVVRSGCLSGFYGSYGDEFLGGPMVRAFETAWRERFGCRHAVSVNSATSGLYAAVGAIGAGPGDEIIVPPLTMSATAMAPLVYGAIPVFADVEPETFCLDLDATRRAITDRTKAIIVVNLFGHPARLAELRELADSRGLALIEDNAQGPLAAEGGRLAGSVGHIGVFSLNYHKHVHTGEGGMCVTDDDELALRLQMIRNHAENIVEPAGVDNIVNMVGFNYRLTELSAAVGLEQLKRVDEHVEYREEAARKLTAGLSGLAGLTTPTVRPGCRHVHYLWVTRLDEEILGVSRELFSRALAAEGAPHFTGYVRPLYLLPLFRRRLAMGRDGWPFTLSERTYGPGLCPVAERLHERELLLVELCMHDLGPRQCDLLIEAIRKVHAGRAELAAAFVRGSL